MFKVYNKEYPNVYMYVETLEEAKAYVSQNSEVNYMKADSGFYIVRDGIVLRKHIWARFDKKEEAIAYCDDSNKLEDGFFYTWKQVK